MHPFRKLLLISLGRETSFEKDPTLGDWKYLYNMALRQTMVGILNDGVHRLPARQMPPEDILKVWDENTAKIAKIYHNHEAHVSELEGLLQRLNLRGCILKGTGLAHLYPKPERRMCGDIDIWIDGKRDTILRAFEEADIPIYDITYQDCKAGIFLDTVVEVHFHPSKLFNPFLNARLQGFYKHNMPNLKDEIITYPEAKFNAVFCIAHMYRHYLGGGIGMRQMLDYYYVLRDLNPSDRQSVMRTLTHMGMKRFTASVMASMWFNFGLEDEFLLCPPDLKHGKMLVNDVFSMGNFGVMDKRNYAYEGETIWARFLRKNHRAFSNLRYYPREVIWYPFARVSQFVWRKVKGYL